MNKWASAKLVSLFLILSVLLMSYTLTTSRADLTGTNGMVTIDNNVIIRQGNGVNYSFASGATISKLELNLASIKLDGWLTIGATTSSGQLTNSLESYTGTLVKWTSTSSAHSATTVFSISGLQAGTNYKATVDGNMLAISPGPSVGFTYVGLWSSHTFIVSETSAAVTGVLQASFSFTLDGANLRCTDLSLGAITTRVWDFGDGSGSSSISPSHRYWKSGTFTVSLTIYDAAGHSSNAQKSITVSVGDIPISRKGPNLQLGFGPIILTVPSAFLIFAGITFLAMGYMNISVPIFSQQGRKFLGWILLIIGLLLMFWRSFL